MSKNATRTGVEVPLGRPSHFVFQETAWKETQLRRGTWSGSRTDRRKTVEE